MQAAAADT